MTPDWTNVDHRRLATLGPSDGEAYLHAMWDSTSQAGVYVEAVHRLTNLGAVVTYVASNTSEDGFHAEWLINLLTVEGELINRGEVFDETDLDAALTRFEELHKQKRRLENAASRTYERYRTSFASRDWAAMAELLTADTSVDDHRRVVNAEIRRGRDAEIANMRAVADTGSEKITSTVVATRGERFALCRSCIWDQDQESGAFRIEFLAIVEIDADGRIAARVAFDLDDIDAALTELDARYLSGEAAAHAHVWSAIAAGYAAFNRHELPATTPDWVNIDHRRARAFAPGDQIQYIHATWDVMPQARAHAEAVHRLSDVGAIVTQAVKGTSTEGFDAEWREIAVLTVAGDLISRCEMFDEEDIDTALARFDELNRQAHCPENAASRAYERFKAYFADRDWDAMAEALIENVFTDDRRPVVRAGVRTGRNVEIANWRALADVGITHVASSVIAIRGEHLALGRVRFLSRDGGSDAFHLEVLGVLEIDADERIAARITLDPDDIDAAFKELETRYLAGEAAANSRTWSLIAATYAALNRHDLPPTSPDWVNLDHRRVIAFAPGDAIAYMRTSWDLTADLTMHIEAVHRLSSLGAVVTHVAHGTSQEGFDAEWRDVSLWTFEGDKINRFEVFDKADLDAALARFDELNRPPQNLENASTKAWGRVVDAFNRRDVDGFLAVHDGRYEDRRKGLRNAGPVDTKFAHAVLLAPNSWRMETEPVAIRGHGLALNRQRMRDTDEADRPIAVETLMLTEVNHDELISYAVAFDPNDIAAAFAELETRYLAGEAATYAQMWSVVTQAYTALNRHELPATMSDWVTIDHRVRATFEGDDLTAYTRSGWDVTPDVKIYIEAVHRLSNLGAVVTHVARGISPEGFEAEWRMVELLAVGRDLINRCELFDEADMETALAKFGELDRPARLQLENAATRTRARLADAFNRRDLEGFRDLAAADGVYEDRRKGLRDAGPARGKVAQALFEATPVTWRSEIEPVAVRGARLALTRDTYRDLDEADPAITVEHFTLTEVGDDDLVSYGVLFDPDDINAAFAELMARWLASGEVAHPEVIEAWHGFVIATNLHDFDALARLSAGATFVNHRQLRARDNIADYMSSIRILVSLIPDMWIEVAEILTHSATSLVTDIVVKGTTAEGIATELPAVLLLRFNGDRLVHMEAFDADQRDLALARFQELNQP